MGTTYRRVGSSQKAVYYNGPRKRRFEGTLTFACRRISTATTPECTIQIEKEAIKFSSGHFTIFSATERERLHGFESLDVCKRFERGKLRVGCLIFLTRSHLRHNFSVSASFTGQPAEDGMMGDYGQLKRILKELCAELDEYFLLPGLSQHLRVYIKEAEEEKEEGGGGENDAMSKPVEVQRVLDAAPRHVVAMFGSDPAELISLPQADVKVGEGEGMQLKEGIGWFEENVAQILIDLSPHILPITNVTVEELARFLVQRVANGYQDDLRSMGVRSYSIRVTSGPGQGAIVSHEFFAATDDGASSRRKQPHWYEMKGDGASSGIGLETAKVFLEAGYEVAEASCENSKK
eukprot:jgi/Bigna1/79411/fgenesh1_pg.62_\